MRSLIILSLLLNGVSCAVLPEVHGYWFQVVGNGLFYTHWSAFSFSETSSNATARNIRDTGSAYESGFQPLCVQTYQNGNTKGVQLLISGGNGGGESDLSVWYSDDATPPQTNYIQNSTKQCHFKQNTNQVVLASTDITYPPTTAYISVSPSPPSASSLSVLSSFALGSETRYFASALSSANNYFVYTASDSYSTKGEASIHALNIDNCSETQLHDNDDNDVKSCGQTVLTVTSADQQGADSCFHIQKLFVTPNNNNDNDRDGDDVTLIGLGTARGLYSNDDVDILTLNTQTGVCSYFDTISTAGQSFQGATYDDDSKSLVLSLSTSFLLYNTASKAVSNITLPQGYANRPFADIAFAPIY